MYKIRALVNHLLVRVSKPKLYLITTSYLSKRYILLNLGSATKGPSSVLHSIRDAALGLKIRHQLIHYSFDYQSTKTYNAMRNANILLLSWGDDQDKFRKLIQNINSPHLIIGPNVEIDEETISFLKNNPNSYCKFLVPSSQVTESLQRARPSFIGIRCQIWPVGVETQKWKPRRLKLRARDSILVYTKGALSEYDNQMINNLKSNYPKICLVAYGAYSPRDFLRQLQKSKAAIFFGGWESQGIAMAESWSCNVPTLVRVQCDCKDHSRRICSMAKKFSPYLDEKCGRYFRSETELMSLLSDILGEDGNQRYDFHPRAWVEHNLETRQQLKSLLK